MIQYDESQMLFVIVEEIAQILRGLSTTISPSLPPKVQAALQDIDTQLDILQKVSTAYVIPSKDLQKLKMQLKQLLGK